MLFMCVINSENARYLGETAAIAEESGVDLCFTHLSFISLKRFTRQKEIVKKEFGMELDDSRGNDVNDLCYLDTRRLSDEIFGIKAKKYKINIYFTQELSSGQIANHYTESERGVINDRCYYPWFGARIGPYGGATICREDYLTVGNILKEPLSRLYNNSQSNKFRDYMRKKLLPLCLRCCWCGSGDLMTTVFGRGENIT
jgi:MoaA/NifB/PqqE/SkfB family radical SAM enzyme